MTYTSPSAILAIGIIFPVLGTIVVFLRFYTRKKAKITLWVDDWLIIPALVMEFALAGLMIWGAVTNSLGTSLIQPDVTGPEGYAYSYSAQQDRMSKISYVFDILVVFQYGFLKLSILFFYRRIFCSTPAIRWHFNVATWSVIVLVVIWTLAFGFGAIFECTTHFNYIFAPIIYQAERCNNVHLPLLEAYAISDFIMDIIIWILPIPKIWSLHMNTRRKLAVSAVFAVGFLTIAASATRMAIYMIYIVNAYAKADGEAIITYLLFWSMIESGLGVIVVCLPTIRSIYGKVPGTVGSLLSGIKSVLTFRSLHSRNGSMQSSSIRLASLDKTPKHSTSISKLDVHAREEGEVDAYILSADDVESRNFSLPGRGARV